MPRPATAGRSAQSSPWCWCTASRWTAAAGTFSAGRWQPKLVERARRMVNDLVWGVTRAYAYGDRTVPTWLVDFAHTMISENAVDALVEFVDTLNSHDRVAALPALAECETL